MDVPKSPIGSRLRSARLGAGLSQQAVADRLGVSQVTISNWERGTAKPGRDDLEALGNFLTLEARGTTADQTTAFGEWLDQTRRQKGLTRRELADRSGISEVQIGNIERGLTRSPRLETRKRLQSALQVELPQDVEAQTVAAAQIPGVGTLEDFDPHNKNEWPAEPGVYVLYDVSERPIYVGKATSVASRIKDHEDKFWFKAPIVQSASFVRVENSELRHQLEQVLIKFLKSNAVINQQGVQR